MDEMTEKRISEKNVENAKPKRRNYSRRPRTAKQADGTAARAEQPRQKGTQSQKPQAKAEEDPRTPAEAGFARRSTAAHQTAASAAQGRKICRAEDHSAGGPWRGWQEHYPL